MGGISAEWNIYLRANSRTAIGGSLGAVRNAPSRLDFKSSNGRLRLRPGSLVQADGRQQKGSPPPLRRLPARSTG